jgi:HlyD family secretion protein
MNMPPLKRIVSWTFIAGVAVVLIVLALKPRPVPADFATVERGMLRVTLSEEGETRVRDRYVISAPLAGRLSRVEFEPGDRVEAGKSVLATLEPSDPSLLDARSLGERRARVKAVEAALDRAGAERDRVQAEFEFGRSELERIERLRADGIVSIERLEAATVEVRTLEKALRAAEFAVRNAEYELEVAVASLRGPGGDVPEDGSSTVRIFSPIDGVVLRRLRESETVVPAGDPLMEVADPAALEIVADYLSSDAVRIREGQRVLVERWGGERPLAGRVRLVEPHGFTKVSALGVEEQRVNVVVDFDEVQESWIRLGDGYHVELQVVVWERSDVLKVPTSGLFRIDDDWAVFVRERGRARSRRVEIGQRNGLEAEVLSGLEEGQEVIVHPSDAIADGISVAPRG